MKKLSLIAFLFSIVILSWCGKIDQKKEISPDVWSYYLSWWTTQELIDNTPDCIPEKLVDIQMLDMDNLVKNCTTKNSKWVDAAWGWWLIYQYKIINNQILAYDQWWDPHDSTVCKIKAKDSDYYEFYFNPESNRLISSPDALTWDFGTWWYAVIQKVIWKWFVDEIASSASQTFNSEPEPSVQVISCSDYSCNTNKDISDMVDYWGRTDGKNYFVAWYRTSNDSKKLVYIINDKVYNPWNNKTDDLSKGKRYFAGIKDNKIIVKRIENYKIVGGIIWQDDQSKLSSEFNVETCEINL